MTKREIISVLKGTVRDWCEWEDPTDKDYLLGILKDGDLDEFFSQLQVCECTNKDLLEELEDEWSALGDQGVSLQ